MVDDDLKGALWHALWNKKDFELLGGDAENKLNVLLDQLELISRDPADLSDFKKIYDSPYTDMPVRIGNRERAMVWRNNVGIPAGVSKDGRGAETLILGLPIGCLELGTSPFLPQPGNPEPRFWMGYDALRAAFSTRNYFGFNAPRGIMPVVDRLWRIRENPECARTPIIVSIGPNKAALERYEEDRDLKALVAHLMLSCAVILPVLRKGDGIQVNISSPNTEGLRNLLNRVFDFLHLFMRSLRELAILLGLAEPVVILKLSPDMPDDDLRRTASAATLVGVAILEAFNTTIDADIKARYGIAGPGGVGGDAARELAERKLAVLVDEIEKTGLDIDAITCLGITEPQHALTRLQMHPRVKAVQINSGIYKKGFRLIPETLAAIAAMAA